MRREPVFSSLDFESPRASDQRYVDSRQFAMLSSAQFRETPVNTASGSLSVHQGSSICSLPPNWLRSISSASGRRSESIGIYRLNFRTIIRQKRSEDPGEAPSRRPEIMPIFSVLNVSVFRISMIITRSDLPKLASNNRHAGTPEENMAFWRGASPTSVRTRRDRRHLCHPH